MYLLELIRQFLRDMRMRKARTFLAIFGIAWGTVAVVLLLAIGDGFHRASMKSMHGLGESIVIVWPTKTSTPFEGLQPGREIDLKCSDIIEMGETLNEIGLYSPEPRKGGRVLSNGSKRVRATVAGVTTDYGEMRNLIAEPGGRFLNTPDMNSSRRVIFIGSKIRDKLFPDGGDVVGTSIMLDGRPFTIVGVAQDKTQNSSYSGRDRDRAIIPYTTYISTWGDVDVSNFVVRPNPPKNSKPMQLAIREYLGERHRFDPADEGALKMWDTIESDIFIDWFFFALKVLFGFGGLLTLGAGGIGVANIMFLIIRERTREIGVRMAVGARPTHILKQVILEAGLMVAIGGGLGMAFSACVVWLVQNLPLPDWLGSPELSFSVAITLAVLATVGLAAGLFPAKRASRLDPVAALES